MIVPIVVVAAHFAAAVPNAALRFDPEDPRWASVAASAESPNRVRECLAFFSTRLLVPTTLRPAAEILAWAAGTTRDAAHTEGLVTPIQGVRALDALADAPSSVRALVDDLLARAGSRAEQAVLLKELAARSRDLRSPSLLGDLHTLADEIRGKPLRWLVENTTCYGTEWGAGLKQSFKDSCMPAIKLLAEAEVDPLFALRVHGGGDGFLRDEERRELESEGGVAAARDDLDHGRGTRDHELLFKLGAELGAKTEVIGRAELDGSVLDRMEQLLEDGVDIPLRIATASGKVAHSVIAVDVHRGDTVRSFRVHDPWTGHSKWFTDDDILHGSLFPTDHGVARQVTHVYLQEP